VGRLLYAADETEARLRLTDKGYEVHEVKKYDFNNWRRTAQKAADAATAAFAARKKISFRPGVWAVLKEHLQDLFNDRCAYCEAYFRHVAFGDVEHYRPKGKVDGEETHPGYFWLAYEPTNYLPSCQRCNQGSAKKDKFPIAGVRAFNKASPLTDERPLLLNPYVDDPNEHLRFATSRDPKVPGWVLSIDSIGQASIDVYELNRPNLPTIRRDEQNSVRLRLKDVLYREDKIALKDLILDCQEGRRQFSAASLAEIDDFFAGLGLSREP